MSRHTIQVGDRWAIIGGTGAGKTQFGLQLLMYYVQAAAYARRLFPIYIFDTKISGDFRKFHQKNLGHLHVGNSVPKLINPMKDGRPFLVWQPEEDDVDMYDAFLHMIYKARTPALVYIDELGSLTNTSATKFPRYYDILLKQGRGLNIGMVSNTQSPSYIPNNLIRQTTHLLSFRLNSDYDQEKIAKVIGREYKEWEPPDEHGFLYRNCTKPKRSSPPIYYHNMQEFFGIA